MLAFELTVVGLLILLNGFFAMSELAVVSSRRARLQQMANMGSRGAERALKLTEDPTHFLSTVQVGITLIGIFAGAYSGSTLAGPLADMLRAFPIFATSADTLAFTVVVVIITYLSLIIGELVPKRVALNNAEAIASFAAPFMFVLSKIGAPVVWFLRVSTEAMLRLLRIKAKPDSTVTEEEVKSMIAEGTDAGVFDPAEKEMIDSVLRLADRSVRSIMVPRPDVMWVDADDPIDTILEEIRTSGHSRFPVSRGDIDEVVGIVHAKDLLAQVHKGQINLSDAIREPIYVSRSIPILKLLERFKSSKVHMAIILDEHGAFEGIATPTDILTSIAGHMPEREGDEDSDAVQREDGSWLFEGRMPVDDVERVLGLEAMSNEDEFTTLAGFALFHFGHIPEAGEYFLWNGWRFEVVDLDGRRIDKMLVSNLDA
jgi:putative hemolysin